jgi:hypothetical protein
VPEPPYRPKPAEHPAMSGSFLVPWQAQHQSGKGTEITAENAYFFSKNDYEFQIHYNCMSLIKTNQKALFSLNPQSHYHALCGSAFLVKITL